MQRAKLLSIILISCLGIIVYSNTFHCSFQWDDDLSIVDNFFIRNIANLQNIWDFWPCRFITYLSIAFNYHFSQLDVIGYHLFNLLIHLASAVLVWWLVLLTLATPVMKENKIAKDADLIALLAGLVFVAHPVQTEAVTYIVQRAASMASFFYLASLCFYVRARLLQKGDGGPYYYVCSLITAVAAMFTKEIAMTLPLMVLLYEFTFLRTDKDAHSNYPTPFLLLIFIIPLTMLLTKSVNFQEMHRVAEGPTGISSLQYLLTQFRVMVTYIRLVFLPVHQNLDYDYPVFKSIFELPVLLSLLFLAAISFFVKHLFSQYRLVSFSILWFFLTLLPESSIFPIKDVIFEHRLYLPMAGYSIFLVSSIYYLLGKHRIKTIVLVLVMIIACYSVLTYQRNKVWKDHLSLWEDTVQKSPYKARPYNDLGNVYLRQGDLIQALSDFNKAIGLNPEYAEAYDSRSGVYAQQGHFLKAISDCNKSIELNPRNYKAYYNIGIIYNEQGDVAQAISDLTKAIELNPWDAQAYASRGAVYGQGRNFIQAIFDFTKAIEIDPGYAQAYYNRAGTYYSLGKYDKAWGDVHQAEVLGYAIDPGFISALKKISGTDKKWYTSGT